MIKDTNFKRVLIKLSGEVLSGKLDYGIDPEAVQAISKKIQKLHSKKIEIGIVIGGGNIFRGLSASANGMDRVPADYLGMLATIMNALSLQSSLEKIKVPTRVQSAISMSQIAESYIRRRALRHLEKNRIVIFAAGTGNPFFSTDTAATLRASELDCSLIIKATKVNGIYDSDPNINPKAKLIKNISYNDVINKDLKVMDLTAVSLAKETKIPIGGIFPRTNKIKENIFLLPISFILLKNIVVDPIV